MSQEDHWERRKRAIRRGQQQGGAAGGRRAEIAFNANEKKRRNPRRTKT